MKCLLVWVLVLCMVFGTVQTTLAAQDASGEKGSLTWEKVENQDFMSKNNTKAEAVKQTKETQFAEDDEVRVFIVFSEDSALDAGYSTENLTKNRKALAYLDEVEQNQEAVIEQISKEALDGEELEVNYQLSLITNAVSAKVEYGKIDDIENVEGVKAVYLAPVYELTDIAEPDTITSGDMVGSYKTWTNGYTGAGTRIAVIDSGLDEDHPSFEGNAYMVSLEETASKAGKTVKDYKLLEETEIAGVLGKLHAAEKYDNLTAENLYRSEKIPFGFNYVDADLNITHDYDDETDHGTHVAGIATANKYVPVEKDGKTTYAEQAQGVVGIAPDAQLMVMKVFGVNGGSYTDDFMAAIEDALLLGADAINLSLGSVMPGFITDIYEGTNYVEEIFDKLVGSDTVVSISASNDSSWGKESMLGGNMAADVDLDTVGSPGSYKNAFTVASVNNSGFTGKFLEFENDNTINYSETEYSNASITTLDENGEGTEYEYVLLEAIGQEADYEDIDVTDKIVMVYRGEISFFEKHNIAEAMGAKALIVVNNAPGSINMDLSSSTATIPCVAILQEQGESVKANAKSITIGNKTVYTGKVMIYSEMMTNYNAPEAWQISEFSSWGVPGDLSLKPEITAPGGNIYSTLTDGKYGQMSGTSMASPSVAGMAALVIQYIQENNLVKKTGLSARTLAQSLLMSTATPLMDGDVEYSPRRQGAGLANVEAATTTPSYILVGDKEGNDGKVKVELGDDPEKKGEYAFDFTVYNMSDTEQFYTLDSTVLTEAVTEEGMLAEKEYRLSPYVSFNTQESDEIMLYDFDLDGDVDVDDADAMIAWINRSENTKLTKEELVRYDFDSDGDYDTNDVYLYLCYIKGTKEDVNINEKNLKLKQARQQQ